MSLWMLLAGFIASTLTGYILDRFKKFKITTLGVTAISCGLYIVFSVLLFEGMNYYTTCLTFFFR